MGTTDAKPGFRLPWSADRDDSGSPSDTSERAQDSGEAVTPEHESEMPQMIDANAAAADASADAATGTDRAPAANQDVAEEPAAPVGDEEAPVAQVATPEDATPDEAAAEVPVATRKPNKFMADLAKAMQAAAESARADTLARFAAEAKTHIEGIHAATANEATELRKLADDDVAAIRDWSKAEIARIREETDDRIAHRKTALDHEVEAHAAEIEARIDLVQKRVTAFEAEMATFFDRLMAEEDPTRFAAMAESLPEPPPFDVDQPWEPVGLIGVEDAPPTDLEPSVAEVVDATPVADLDAPIDPDAVAAETTDAATDTAWAPDPDAAANAGWDTPVEPLSASVEAPVDPDAPAVADEADPVGFAEAEAEAAEFSAEADASDEDIPVLAEDALAARMAGLVPDADAGDAGDAVTTRLIVTGLVSVASIAGFKRHLSRLSGVVSVGVSSGPDGEFVFAVAHADGLALDAAIASLPGFSARVTDAREGELTVAARDPEAEG